MHCPEYYIDAINQTTVVRHILITHRNLIGFKPDRRRTLSLSSCDKSLLFNVHSEEMI